MIPTSHCQTADLLSPVPFHGNHEKVSCLCLTTPCPHTGSQSSALCPLSHCWAEPNWDLRAKTPPCETKHTPGVGGGGGLGCELLVCPGLQRRKPSTTFRFCPRLMSTKHCRGPAHLTQLLPQGTAAPRDPRQQRHPPCFPRLSWAPGSCHVWTMSENGLDRQCANPEDGSPTSFVAVSVTGGNSAWCLA